MWWACSASEFVHRRCVCYDRFGLDFGLLWSSCQHAMAPDMECFWCAGLDFVFHMYFLVKYCRSLEEGSFRSRSADFFWMLAIGAPSAITGQTAYTYQEQTWRVKSCYWMTMCVVRHELRC